MRRRHLFIQLGSYPIGELAQHLEALYQEGGELVDLIVTQTGDAVEGRLYNAHLDVLDPYLPWGPKRIAANVFFGTNVNYAGKADPYGADMKNREWRWDLLMLQRRILQRLSARYQGQPWHFYIEHEAVLNKITADPYVRAGYEAYLIHSVRDFRDMFRPAGAVAWSPAFWQLNPSVSDRTTLDGMFKRIKQFTSGPGIDWILLQDMIGRPWGGNVTPLHVREWYNALGDSFRSKQVNMELFRIENGHSTGVPVAEVRAREEAYERLGMNVGASWEMRWHMRAPAEPVRPSLWSLADDGQGASWPWLAAHNTWSSRLAQVRGWLADGVHRGSYSRRAELAEYFGRQIAKITGLEVQGIRYMRPVSATGDGRSSNSDHFTAGAIDIMIRPSDPQQTKWLPQLYALLAELEKRHVVRYTIKLGANDAHWNHIHVSFQIGAKL